MAIVSTSWDRSNTGTTDSTSGNSDKLISTMRSKLNKTLFIILNAWLAFTVMIWFIFRIPAWHWPVDSYIIVNYSLYFLSFLVSLCIFRKSLHNRYVFLNFTLLTLLYSISFIQLLIGKDYIFGDDYLMYQVIPYRKFALSLLMGLVIVYTIVDYLYNKDRTWLKYGKSLLVVLPIIATLYYNFIVDKSYILVPEHFKEMLLCSIESHLFALFFIGLYGFIYYKKERPLGEGVNSLMAILFFVVVYDIFDGISEYYNIEIARFSQYTLSLLLLAINYVLIRRLRTTYSSFGKFYESLLFSEKKVGLKIHKRTSGATVFIKTITNYFSEIPNRVVFIALMATSLVLFGVFFPEGYGKRLVFAFVISISIFIIYLKIVTNKKSRVTKIFY